MSDFIARTGQQGPLSGIRVLDLSAYIAGPYGCSLLADQGAEVIKIEPPAGDNLRKYPSTLEAESRSFVGVNRSKTGIVLDLKTGEGIATHVRRSGPQLQAECPAAARHCLRATGARQSAADLLRRHRLWRKRPAEGQGRL